MIDDEVLNKMYIEQQHRLLLEMIEQEQRITEWYKRGEEIMARAASWSVMFYIGQWWADRPWRDRGEKL